MASLFCIILRYKEVVGYFLYGSVNNWTWYNKQFCIMTCKGNKVFIFFLIISLIISLILTQQLDEKHSIIIFWVEWSFKDNIIECTPIFEIVTYITMHVVPKRLYGVSKTEIMNTLILVSINIDLLCKRYFVSEWILLVTTHSFYFLVTISNEEIFI